MEWINVCAWHRVSALLVKLPAGHSEQTGERPGTVDGVSAGPRPFKKRLHFFLACQCVRVISCSRKLAHDATLAVWALQVRRGAFTAQIFGVPETQPGARPGPPQSPASGRAVSLTFPR